MAEIVNLRRARKAQARAEQDKAAAANRALHGTPKSRRKLAQAHTEQAQKRLSGHQLDPEDGDK